MMNMRDDYDFDDLPELEEAEYTPVFARRGWVEDGNDIDDFGDSFSIGLDVSIGDEIIAPDA